MSAITTAQFSGTYQENSGSVSGSLNLNQIVAINGNTNLSSAIYFQDGGFVQTIQYVAQGGVYPNAVQVTGQAPSGLNGHINLTFTDSTGTNYSLSIYSTSLEQHTLDIFGGGVEITKIAWVLG